MAKDVAPIRSGALIDRAALAKNLAASAMSIPQTGDSQFLKMEQDSGNWVFGVDQTEVEKDSLWAVNPGSFEHGYIAWHKSQPENEVMVPVARPLPDVTALPPVQAKDGYQQQRGVQLVCISGADEGSKVVYKHSSGGAMKLFGKLVNDLLDQLEKDPDNCVPIIRMTSTRYKNTRYGGYTYNPVFEIVEFRSLDDVSPVNNTDDNDEDDEETKPKRSRETSGRKAQARQEPEEEPEENPEEDEVQEAATPRRRRRTA